MPAGALTRIVRAAAIVGAVAVGSALLVAALKSTPWTGTPRFDADIQILRSFADVLRNGFPVDQLHKKGFVGPAPYNRAWQVASSETADQWVLTIGGMSRTECRLMAGQDASLFDARNYRAQLEALDIAPLFDPPNACLDGNGSLSWAIQRAYDPSRCKFNPDRKFYIALGRTVLAIDRKGDVVSNPVTGDQKLAAPDPKEPKGCPRNPSQQGSYTFFPSAYPFAGTNAAALTPRFLTLYGVALDQAWPGEMSQLTLSAHLCDTAKRTEELPSGLIACRVAPKQPVRVEDWAASYHARDELYATPTGKPFVVNCDPLLYANRIGQCRVAYAMSPGFAVSYSFSPFGPGAIPIDRIIAFDRGLRAAIDSRAVKNYAWSN